MTYCVAIHVNEGIAFLSDSRTNAGVDQLSTYSKMFTFVTPGERTIVLLTAGNLATTQAVIKAARRDIVETNDEHLLNLKAMDAVAAYIGRLNYEQVNNLVKPVSGNGLSFHASFIVGGQIGKQEAEVYLVYPEGNYIASTRETPYQQIGETKYGKPILDRIITPETGLQQAALCGMVSMDSTMRSNATVGPPIEVLMYQNNSLALSDRAVYKRDDSYLLNLRRAWESALISGFKELPPLQPPAQPPLR